MPQRPAYKAFKPPRPVLQSSNVSTSNGAPAEELNQQPNEYHMISSASETEEQPPAAKRKVANATGRGRPDELASPSIPKELLTYLAHHHFEHRETAVTVEAMRVFAKYIEAFTVEAVGRASAERDTAVQNGSDSTFLEVEDLEKLAPQLLLDF